MQGLYDIAMALIPQIPWIASCYIICTICKNSHKTTTISLPGRLKIKMKKK